MAMYKGELLPKNVRRTYSMRKRSTELRVVAESSLVGIAYDFHAHTPNQNCGETVCESPTGLNITEHNNATAKSNYVWTDMEDKLKQRK